MPKAFRPAASSPTPATCAYCFEPQLAFAFERLGGTLSPSAASDWLGLGTTVLAENLAEAASLIDLVYSTPRLAEAEVERERGLMIAEADQVTDDMFRYPFQLAFEAAFGEQGYGLPVTGLPHTLPAITAADVSAWHSRALLAVRPVVIAVGDRSKVGPALEAEFSLPQDTLAAPDGSVMPMAGRVASRSGANRDQPWAASVSANVSKVPKE